MRSKAKNIWRCNGCMSKQCTIRSELGKWPTEAFRALAKEQQAAFYQQVAQLEGHEVVKKAQEVTLTTFQEKAEHFYDSGWKTSLADWPAPSNKSSCLADLHVASDCDSPVIPSTEEPL